MFEDDEPLMEEKILTNCGPYLNLLKELSRNGIKKPLLRGSATPYDSLTKLAVKERPSPINTELIDHEISNQWFKDNFGIEARSKTVFVTTNRGLASRYGEIHYIFPIGKFSIINSEKYADLFLKFGWMSKVKIFRSIYGTPEEYPNIETYEEAKKFLDSLKEKDPEKYEKIIHTILSNGEYKKNNFKEAFRNGNEIMLKCKSFYIIKEDERIKDFINDFIWDDIFI